MRRKARPVPHLTVSETALNAGEIIAHSLKCGNYCGIAIFKAVAACRGRDGTVTPGGGFHGKAKSPSQRLAMTNDLRHTPAG